jgi:hypothetical protein
MAAIFTGIPLINTHCSFFFVVLLQSELPRQFLRIGLVFLN